MALACREVAGSPTCTTLAGTVRMEIYPVGTLTQISSSDPINKLKNPSAIILYSDDSVTDNTVSILELTRYQPTNLNIGDDDSRVQWSITSQGGYAKFYKGNNTGNQVKIYGIAEGEILVEADYGWINKAKFRAEVVALKQLRFRVSRLSTKTASPTASIGDIKKHIRVANIYLRQVGIKLVPDDSSEVATNAGNPKAGDPGFPAVAPAAAVPGNDANIDTVAAAEKGYFEVALKDTPAGNNLTQTSHNIANWENAIRVNALNEVINIAYVHSLNSPPVPPAGTTVTVGACVLNPVNHGGPPAPAPAVGSPRPAPSAAAVSGTHTIVDSGTPSTSWVAPNGLPSGSLPTPVAPPVPAGASSRRTPGLLTRDGGGDPTGVPAGPVTMKLLRCVYDWSSPTFVATSFPAPFVWQPDSVVNRDRSLQWGLVMDGQSHGDQEFGNTLAHELGHFFGLRHRGQGGGPDGVAWPQWENLMDGSAPSPDCENLDVIQCQAVRFSEIFFRSRAEDTSPEYEPSDHTGLGTLGGAVLGALAGALLGAAVGAVIGFLVGGPSGALTGALIGAGAGAIAGAIIGGILGSPSVLP